METLRILIIAKTLLVKLLTLNLSNFQNSRGGNKK
jgi:hypothetical protein